MTEIAGKDTPVPYKLSFGCMHLRCCRAYIYGDKQSKLRIQTDCTIKASAYF